MGKDETHYFADMDNEGEMLARVKNDCPLGYLICPDGCPYNKMPCDYPWIGAKYVPALRRTENEKR